MNIIFIFFEFAFFSNINRTNIMYEKSNINKKFYIFLKKIETFYLDMRNFHILSLLYILLYLLIYKFVR